MHTKFDVMPSEKGALVRPSHRWRENIETDLRAYGMKVWNRIQCS